MRILQVNKYLYPRDGVTTVVAQTLRILAERGHHVMAFGQAGERNFTSEMTAAYAPAIDLENPRISAGRRAAALARILCGTEAVAAFERFIRAIRPDLVHLHNIYHHLSPRIIPSLTRRRIPIVMTLHDYKLFCPGYRLLRPDGDGDRLCDSCIAHGPFDAVRFRCIKRSALASLVCWLEALAHRRYWSAVRMFIAPSEFMAARAVEAGIPRRKVRIVRNAAPGAPPGARPRKARPQVILFLGRLHAEKGVRTLIDAWALAGARGATLVIAGDGPEREAIEAHARARGVPARFPGFLDGDAKARALAEATALAFPSRWYENCPMAVLEAFAHGTPVIASLIGGIPEIVKDGANGLLVPPGDAHALAGAISTLCADHKLAARLGRAAARDAERDFGEERYAREIGAVYRDAARDCSRR